MKGFIELHEVITGDRSLIGIGNVACVADCHNEGTLIQFPTSQIGVRESYEEVKALIAEAQGDVDTISKIELKNWVECEKERIENTPILNDREKGVRLGMLQELVEFLAKEEL